MSLSAATRLHVWRVAILGLTLGAFGVRVWRLDRQPLWWDEGITVYMTTLGPSAWLRDLPRDHPPLYYLMLNAVALVSRDPFTMRFPSVVFGTLTVPLLGVLGQRLFGLTVGVVAALLLTVSPFAVHHSQEARMYTMLPFLALLSWAALLGVITASTADQRAHPWHYTTSLALAFATHYYSALLPVAHAAYRWFQPEGRRWLRPWLRSVAWAIVASLPWVIVLVPDLPRALLLKVTAEKEQPWPLFPFFARYAQTEIFGYPSAQSTWLAVVGWAIIALAGVAAFSLMRQQHEPRSIVVGLLASVALPVALAYLANLVVPFPAFPRLLSFTLGPLLVLVAAALTRLARSSFSAGWGAAAILLLLSLWLLYDFQRTPRPEQADYRPLAATLERLAQPQDLVVYDLPWQMGFIVGYLGSPPVEGLVLRPPDAAVGLGADRLQPLAERAASARRIWYPAYQALGGTEGQGAHAYLASHAYLAFDAPFGTTRLLLFDTRTNFTKAPSLPLASPMGPDIQLLGFSLPPTDAATPKLSYHSHEIIPLALFWQTSAPLDISYTAFVHLVDAAGQPVLFADDEPDRGQRPTTSWSPGETIADLHSIHLPSTLPTGPYRIYVGLYDSLTGRRLPVDPPHPEGRFLTTVSVELMP